MQHLPTKFAQSCNTHTHTHTHTNSKLRQSQNFLKPPQGLKSHLLKHKNPTPPKFKYPPFKRFELSPLPLKIQASPHPLVNPHFLCPCLSLSAAISTSMLTPMGREWRGYIGPLFLPSGNTPMPVRFIVDDSSASSL